MGWFIRFACRAIMPGGGRFKGVEATDLTAFLADIRADGPPLFRVGLVVTSLVFIGSPVLTIFVPLPAFLLPKRLLELHAQRAVSHRFYWLRQSTLMVKMVAGLCWSMDTEVRKELGLAALPPDPRTWRQGE